jgi:putative ABC transport system permease protein
MTLASRLRSWVQVILLRSRMESEMDAELRFHIEAFTEDLIRSGVPRQEAMRRARLEFGGIEQAKEGCRDARGASFVEGLLQDLRFGARLLRKSPGFTAVGVITLALGIGASTAVFSIVEAVLLRALPYKSAERLVAVWCTEIGQPGTKIFASYRDFEEFKAHSHSFEELAAVTWARAGEILTWRGSPHEVLAIPASAEFFSLLGVPAAEGRTFGPQDLQTGCTVVLAHSFWNTELAAPTGIVGSTLTLSGKPCAVVGIMPRSFEFYPKQTSLWTLITPDSRFSKEPFDSVVGIVGRLKPGITPTGSEQELVALHQRVTQESPAGSWVAQIRPIVRDLREEFTWMAGRNLRRALLILSAAVTLLLLIACLNVANLLLGRSVERHRELAVRAALGSGRRRLLRQLLTESMLLAALGTVFGMLIAVSAVRYFNASNLVELPPGDAVVINFYVLGFAILLTTVTGLLFGLLPAWRASEVDLNEALKESGRSIASAKHHSSQLLVMSQVTLSMVLLAGAALMIQSIVRLATVPLGFRPDHLLTAHVALPPSAYTSLGQRSAFYEKLTVRMNEIPNVQGVALCSSLPGYEGGHSSALSLAGKAPIENLEAVNRVEISTDYFRVLGIPLLEGRAFDLRDREGSQQVALVNDQLVRDYFAKKNPIGEQIKLGRPEDKAPWLTIIGVVGDEKRTTVYQEMGYAEPALVYLPVNQDSSTTIGLVMRIAGNPLGLSPVLQREISTLDRNVPVYDIRTMSARYAEFLAQPRFRAVMMGIFAGFTLLLAAIGLYGVLAHLVSQRTHEIGIRLALGASRREVLGLVVVHGLRMTVTGLAVGTTVAMLCNRFLSGLLFGVNPTDAITFGAVAIILCMVALLACYVPARRATRVDPIAALRYE